MVGDILDLDLFGRCYSNLYQVNAIFVIFIASTIFILLENLSFIALRGADNREPFFVHLLAILLRLFLSEREIFFATL
jgi:hypothetical protein